MKNFLMTEEQKNKLIAFAQEIPTKFGLELIKFSQALPELPGQEEASVSEEKLQTNLDCHEVVKD